MNRPTIYFSAVLVLSFSVVLSSCYRADRASRYFHYNDMSGIASLDPAFAKNQSVMWAVHQLYSTLVEVDSQLHIVPLLARSWELSSDRRVYTFHLRRDVFFHDDPSFPGGRGRRLTAEDVAYSFRRLLDSRLASPGAWIFHDKVEAGNAFSAPDDSTFQLRLARPYSPMLGILSMQYCSVVPREAVERYGPDFRRHPVGTGPFQFTAWEEGQDLLMRRNPRYFERDSSGRQLPYLDGIHISFFDSKATEFLLFRQGQLDFINDIDASFKDEVLTKAGQLRPAWAGRIVLRTHPYLNIEYLGFLVDSTNTLLARSPVRLRRFRQAINYGFDRQKMMLYLRNSLGTPAQSGFLPAGLPSFDSVSVKGYHYDPAMSRRLLAQAGFSEGKGLPATTLYTIPNYADMANFIAQQLGEIGIPIQVEVVQKSLLLQMTASSQALFFRGSWIADYPDGENYLSVFYSRNPAPPNYTRYANPAFDAVFEKALEETNDSLRYQLYRQADQLVMEDAPVVPLWYDEVVWLCQPGLSGFRPNALNLLELRRTRLEHS
ncbi:MAG TPA: ABC transporter substrate-binding protein [Chitinophagaceae bacterium]|nr:ABC transporter substrate-binding protein [Chitinophagaceae bacterium]